MLNYKLAERLPTLPYKGIQLKIFEFRQMAKRRQFIVDEMLNVDSMWMPLDVTELEISLRDRHSISVQDA